LHKKGNGDKASELKCLKLILMRAWPVPRSQKVMASLRLAVRPERLGREARPMRSLALLDDEAVLWLLYFRHLREVF
jgi:hypothetical protein